jgi:putative transposase
MSQTLSPSLARCYGLARVSRAWKISRASVYRSLKETPPKASARRPGPVGACSDAELADHIRQQIAASRLHGEGYASYGRDCASRAFAQAPAGCDG